MRLILLGVLLPVLRIACVEGADVIDGDTIVVENQTFRLHGIDAPELEQPCRRSNGASWPCGKEAANALRTLVAAGSVRCSGGERDAYGRVIAVCWAGDVELNSEMVRLGWSVAFRRYSDDYVDVEARAQESKSGIWAGDFELPEDYRRSRWASAGQTAPNPDCPIKGNINRKGDRIYHMPWSRAYERTKINTSKGERWFCSEDEAITAGWRAPRYN